jgi:hypothetical protein
MARERWFFAQGSQRRGPAPLSQLVESVLGQPDPRAVLVWRKGFADWTRAEDVPEVERRIAPFLARKAAEEAARRAPAAPPPPAPSPRPPARVEEAKPGSPALVYGGIAAGVFVLGLLGWLFWPRAQPTAPPVPVPLGGTTAEDAPAVVIPAPPPARATRGAVAPATPTPTPPPPTRPAATPTPAVAAMADRETDLPKGEMRKLRSVWAWEADTLKGTVYNGTAWRVTELYVRVGRFVNEDFIEDPRPIRLVPPGAQVDAGVADLLSRVAPDRKRPGVNPLDTGVFEGKAGQRPENFRAEIESARGYAPR